MIAFGPICRTLGKYFIYLTLVLCIPFVVSLIYEWVLDPHSHPQAHASLAFLKTLLISGMLAFLFSYLGKESSADLRRKESIVLVVAIWFLTAAVGALPFLFTKTLESPIDAYFESMSGLTTTGTTVFHPKAYDSLTGQEVPIKLQVSSDPPLTYTFYGTIAPIRDPHTQAILYSGVEAVGKALLFWRSFLQWLGGMGIVVLFIAVLPALLMGGKFLFETEVPGHDKEALTPRIKETASLLWKIYLGLTVAQVVLLMSTNNSLSLFDAITLSFSTISTGGFSTTNAGIAGYHSVHTEWITTLFMILGGLNFSFYFHCLRGKIYRVYHPEFFLYLGILAVGVLLVSWNLWDRGNFSPSAALRYGSFQAVSAQTSTGFMIGDYLRWPFFSQLMLLLLLFPGGMSGSTSGGIKISRIYILFRVIGHKLEAIFRPHAVRCLKVGDKEISAKIGTNVLTFFCLVILLSALGTFLLTLDRIDPATAFGTIACMLNNAGLIFGAPGTAESAAFLPPLSKIISIIWMVLGRLEFFALLVLCLPSFWRQR